MGDAPVRLDITDEAFAYLVIQRGGIQRLEADRPAWEAAYHRQVEGQVESLLPHLPAAYEPDALRILDVGSGLGGVDLMLQHALPGAQVTLLDGLADPPRMHLHRQTFNSMEVAQRWWQGNGGRIASYVDPHTLTEWSMDGGTPQMMDSRFNLVLSFGSWCFHYPPALYLGWVKQRLAPGALVCLEVREEKTEWLKELVRAFGWPVACVHTSKKYQRLVFHP
jgi:hypothetical protein